MPNANGNNPPKWEYAPATQRLRLFFRQFSYKSLKVWQNCGKLATFWSGTGNFLFQNWQLSVPELATFCSKTGGFLVLNW